MKDLTMPVNESIPPFPGDPELKVKQLTTISKDGSNTKRISINSHFSTHIDAPFHMFEDGKKLEEIPIETFIGEAIVLEIDNPDISKVKERDIVFFYTGKSENIDSNYFKNTPTISEQDAMKLIKKKVKIIGVDSSTIDSKYTVHDLFLKKGILLVENLVNLKEFIGKRFQCVIAPLKLKEDGAPCRVFAL